MLKLFRKVIANRAPGRRENSCFSDEEILFKLKTACWTSYQCFYEKDELFKNSTWLSYNSNNDFSKRSSK